MKRDCRFKLYVVFDKSDVCLKIAKANFEHNHAVGPDIYKLYPKNRKLTKEEEDFVLQLLTMRTPVTSICRHYANTSDRVVTSQDIHNIRSKSKFEQNGGKSESVLLNQVVEDIMSDENNHVFRSVDEEGVLTCLVIILSAMREWFYKNPQILHIDGTYKVSDF